MATSSRLLSAAILSLLLWGVETAASAEQSSGPAQHKSDSKSATKSKEDASKDAEAPANHQELAEDLTFYQVPPNHLKRIEEKVDLQYSQELRGLLVDGFKDHTGSLAAARKRFDAATRIVTDDPRSAYAYGIVLMAQKKRGEALEQFRVSAKAANVTYLPALQGIAWSSVSAGEIDQAVAALDDLGTKLSDSTNPWPTMSDKEASAEWQGRMLSYLAGPGQTEEFVTPVKKLRKTIESRLPAPLKAAYSLGWKSTTTKWDELRAVAAQPAENSQASIRKKRDELNEAASAAKAQVTRLEEEIRSSRKDHEKQVADLHREQRSYGTKIKSLAMNLEVIQSQVMVLSVARSYTTTQMTRYGPRVNVRAESNTQRQARQAQLKTATADLEQIQSALTQARQALTGIIDQQKQASADLKTELGDKPRALAAAQRSYHDLLTQMKDADQTAVTPEVGKSQVTSLESYVPMLPEFEKDRLLATLEKE